MQPAFAEQYGFIVEVNDGARLWIGDTLMFDNFDEVSANVSVADTSYFVLHPAERPRPRQPDPYRVRGNVEISSWNSCVRTPNPLDLFPAQCVAIHCELIATFVFLVGPWPQRHRFDVNIHGHH